MGRDINEGLKRRISRAVRVHADSAFWAAIAKEFPEIKTGDLSPDAHVPFLTAAIDAVTAWVDENLPEEMTPAQRELVRTAAQIVEKFGPEVCGWKPEGIADYLKTLAEEPEPFAKPEDWSEFAAKLPEYRGWKASWEFPGYIAWRHPSIAQLELHATPDTDDGTPEIAIGFNEDGGLTKALGDALGTGEMFPWPDKTQDSYMSIVGAKIDKAIDEFREYKNAAERLLIDSGLSGGDDGDYNVAYMPDFCVSSDPNRVGSWVTVRLFIDRSDLTKEGV